MKDETKQFDGLILDINEILTGKGKRFWSVIADDGKDAAEFSVFDEELANKIKDKINKRTILFYVERGKYRNIKDIGELETEQKDNGCKKKNKVLEYITELEDRINKINEIVFEINTDVIKLASNLSKIGWTTLSDELTKIQKKLDIMRKTVMSDEE